MISVGKHAVVCGRYTVSLMLLNGLSVLGMQSHGTSIIAVYEVSSAYTQVIGKLSGMLGITKVSRSLVMSGVLGITGNPGSLNKYTVNFQVWP